MRRLVRGYESDADRQRDLLQEMHIELWSSLKRFDHRCSLRTWVYRVAANNVGADHLTKRRKVAERLVELEALSFDPTAQAGEAHVRRREELAELQALIHRLAPLDRQIILLYLEGETAEEIAEVTGLTAGNTATKIHRIKKLLNRNFTGDPMNANDDPRDLWKRNEATVPEPLATEICALARRRQRESDGSEASVWWHSPVWLSHSRTIPGSSISLG